MQVEVYKFHVSILRPIIIHHVYALLNLFISCPRFIMVFVD